MWAKEGGPDGDGYYSDDEDLAGSDDGSNPSYMIDLATLTAIDLFKLERSILKNC